MLESCGSLASRLFYWLVETTSSRSLIHILKALQESPLIPFLLSLRCLLIFRLLFTGGLHCFCDPAERLRSLHSRRGSLLLLFKAVTLLHERLRRPQLLHLGDGFRKIFLGAQAVEDFRDARMVMVLRRGLMRFHTLCFLQSGPPYLTLLLLL